MSMLVYTPTPPPALTLGGKARGLYQLQELGHAVPPFAVLPAQAFDPLLGPAWQEQGEASALRQQLLNYRLPADTLQQLEGLLQGWGFPQKAVVVRSSVADEDGQQHAFPGMMDSFLNLRSLEAVEAAIATCAASAYSDRAMAYRRQKGLSLQARPAVIIQQQVAASASGLMFTTFPEYPQELAIHALWGFGEGLMSGRAEADEFYFLKKEGRLHRQKLTQKALSLEAAGQQGLAEAPVAQEKQHAPSLSEQQLQQLFALGQQLEKSLGRPQDIEFALEGDRLFLLQTRPITQPIPEVVVYDNSNIQESYCGVTTPLTFSFASRAYATVYHQTMQVLGLPQARIAEQEGVVTNLLGLVKGRIYYNINNWYRGLQLLPSFRQNKEDMERMMGVQEPVDFVEDQEKGLGQKLRMLPGLLLNLWRLWRSFGKLPQRVPAFKAHFQQVYGPFYQQELSTLSPAALLAQKEALDSRLLRNWTTPIINDFWVMMRNGKVRRQLTKAGIAQPEEFLSRYLSGDQEIESTQPTKAMLALATTARRQPALQALLYALPHDLHQQLGLAYPDFYQKVNAFIAQYGDRTVGELKLETTTMRLQPLIFYKYLRNYLHQQAPLPLQELSGLSVAAKKELEEALQKRSPLLARSLWKSLAQLQQAIRYRESLRLERTRLFGMYRALYRAMGATLLEKGILSAVEDVFYLTEEELLEALQRPATPLLALVAERKREFEGYRPLEVPARVVLPSPPLEQPDATDGDPSQLQGAGCYPGRVAGELIVIRDPSDDLDVRDKIICALRTDPGWAALFPACRGVLIEKGSSLSHSVILLRELGIPTIINIPRLTQRLQSGQQVEMDGSSGHISLFPHA
jgi:rifampicin phosphotransferase